MFQRYQSFDYHGLAALHLHSQHPLVAALLKTKLCLQARLRIEQLRNPRGRCATKYAYLEEEARAHSLEEVLPCSTPLCSGDPTGSAFPVIHQVAAASAAT